MRYRTQLVVDFNRFSRNVEKLKERCPQSQILFMVKADAYGHGALPLVEFAYREAGIREFGLASLGEALEIRENLPDVQCELYTFSDVQLGLEKSREAYLYRRIYPVISNLRELSHFLEDREFRYFPLTLKFNTGMNRLGLKMFERERVIEMVKKSGRKSIHHLMSHFACASQSIEENLNQKQLQNFETLKRDFRASGLDLNQTSLSNSGAIEQNTGLDESHIRPGLMLYGPSSMVDQSLAENPWDGEIISRLETYILELFSVEKGDPIGYGGTQCPSRGIMAILALGYGDGLFARYRGAQVFHRGHVGEIFGRLNMDMAQVFFPRKAEKDLQIGDPISIWGHDQQRFRLLSQQTKTIPYELFCQLTPRVPKIYRLE